MFSDEPVVRARLSEALETVLNKTQEPNKSKKVQHSNAKNAVLFEAINLILHFQGSEQLFSILILACYRLYTPTCTCTCTCLASDQHPTHSFAIGYYLHYL